VPKNAISTLTPRNAIQFVVFNHSDFHSQLFRLLHLPSVSWHLSAATQ